MKIIHLDSLTSNYVFKGVNNLQADRTNIQVFLCADDNKIEKKGCNNSDWFALQKILIICVW